MSRKLISIYKISFIIGSYLVLSISIPTCDVTRIKPDPNTPVIRASFLRQVSHATGPTANGKSVVVVVVVVARQSNRAGHRPAGRPASHSASHRRPQRKCRPCCHRDPESWWWQIDKSARSPSETIGDRYREGRSNKQLLIITADKTERKCGVDGTSRYSDGNRSLKKTWHPRVFWQIKWLMLREMTLLAPCLLEVCLLKPVVIRVTAHVFIRN